MNNLTRNLLGLVDRDRIKQTIFDRRLEISKRWHQNLSEGQDMDSRPPRERFKAVTQFRKPDRLRLYQQAGIDDETMLHWIKEGIPIEEVVGQSEVRNVEL
jgi:hypothetical protein